MTTTARETAELVGRFVDAINEEDWNAVGDLLAEDVVIHGEDVRGIDAVIKRHQDLHDAFPDQTLTIEDTVAEGDKVAYRTTVTATHEGEFQGIEPTSEEIEISGISIARVEAGSFAEFWAVEDTLGLLQQLGAVEPPGE